MITKQITKSFGLFGLAVTLLSSLNSAATPAGILFVSKDSNGTVRVLLGREAKGGARGTWCDCGGKGNRNETAWQTACREAAEETRAYFRPKGTRANALRASIQHLGKKQSLGHVTQYWHGSNGYHMYVVPTSSANPAHILQGAYKKHAEKDSFRWVSLEGLLHDISQGHTHYRCRNGTLLPLRPEFINMFLDPRNGYTPNRNFRTMRTILKRCKATL